MSNVVVIVPEAWEYIPQGRATPVKLYAETFIRKGASVGNYLFVDSQDIAGIDKTPLRSCDNWIMGRQKEAHEVDRVREILGMKISDEEIRSLQLGHFYAYLGDRIVKTYVLPAGVPEEMGIDVAIGKLTPDDVRDFLIKNREGGDEKVYRQKYEEAQAEVDRLRKALEEKGSIEESPAYKDLKQRFEEVMENRLTLSKEAAKLEEERDKLKKDLENFEALRKALIGLLPASANAKVEAGTPAPESISVTQEKPSIEYTQQRKKISTSDSDLLGKLVILYAEGELGTIAKKDGWFTTGDVFKLFQRRAWGKDPRAINVLRDLTQWGFLEARMSGRRPEFKVKLLPEEAKKQGLLIVREVQS